MRIWSKDACIGRVAALGFILALAIPLLWPGLPPLIDLMGHIGRYRIQLDIDHSAALRTFFAVHWRIIPNLGVDIAVMALAPLIGLEPAVKAIVIMIPVITGAGFLLVAREIHGRIPSTALFALPLVYSWPFQAGFVNYTLSMALAMVAFGFWLKLGRQGRTRLRAGFFLIVAPLIWITHIYGWAVLCVLAFMSGLIITNRAGNHWITTAFRTALSCLPLGLPVVMIALWHQQGTGATAGWLDWRMVGTWLVTLLRDRWRPFDVVSALILYSLAVAPFLFRRTLVFDWKLAVPAAVLWALAVLIPNALSGSYFAGVRIIPFAMAMTILAIRPQPETTPRARQFLAFSALLFFGLRIGAQTIDYAASDASNARNLAALAHVPTGAKIVTLVGQTCGRWMPSRHLHLPELATARRSAFTNGHWDMEGGQVIKVLYKAGAPFTVDPSQFVNVTGCADRFPTMQASAAAIPLSAFDYLWVVEVPSIDWPKNPRLRPIWTNGSSVLYRIAPGAGSAR